MTKDLSHKWLGELRKAKPDSDYYWYEDCEKAAFNLKFGEGNWSMVSRDEDDDYQGQTRIIIQDKQGQYYNCEYYWGSCSGCDTLQGEGEYVACEYILEEIKPLITKSTGGKSND